LIAISTNYASDEKGETNEQRNPSSSGEEKNEIFNIGITSAGARKGEDKACSYDSTTPDRKDGTKDAHQLEIHPV